MRHTSLSLLLALQGCWWTAPAHDDGDESFVAQAVETILGRKPKGSAEIRALADLAASHGRGAVVELLFEQPEYVDYWTQVLADDLEVQRTGAMRLDADCTAPPLLSEDLSVRLAGHLATADPEEPFCTWVKAPERVRFDPSVYTKAIDQAIAEYAFTPLDQLPVPEPMDEIPDLEPQPEDEKFVDTPSFEIDLDVLGSVSTNDNHVSGLDTDKVVDPDIKRWWDLARDSWQWECPPFNLSDVIAASVRADRLDGVYRAYLPVFTSFPGAGDEETKQGQLGAMFLDAYLDRDPTCMGCHTATYSKTDARPLNGNWDRFDPIWYGLGAPLDAEGTVFSYDLSNGYFVYGGDGGDRVRQQVNNLFRSDSHIEDGIRPWGIDEKCVSNPTLGYDGLQWVPPDPSQASALGGVGPSNAVGVLDLVMAYSEGVRTLPQLRLYTPDWEYQRERWGFPDVVPDPGCTSCHDRGAEGIPWLADRVPLMTDTRLVSIMRFGSGRMRAVKDNDYDAWRAVQWLRQNYPYTPALQMRDRRHGLVFLTAANTVNHIVDEVMGEDLVMSHGFSRNPDQARALSQLTLLYMQSFSLKDVLREIVLSDAFNRKPPEEPTTEGYTLQMLPYPEAEVSPAVRYPPFEANANSEGDFVHKHSPAGLLHQVHEALGWPAPPMAGDSDLWPQAELMRSIGRYASRSQREREQFGVDTFVAWENGVATCEKPELVLARDVHLAPGESASPVDEIGPDQWLDWVDMLVLEGTERRDTWRELAVSLKDRLLADPEILPIEELYLGDMWDGVDLDRSPADDGEITGDEQALLREYCGVLMASPQFLLRGVRLANDLPYELPEPTCLPEETCDEDQLYDRYVQQLKDLGISEGD